MNKTPVLTHADVGESDEYDGDERAQLGRREHVLNAHRPAHAIAVHERQHRCNEQKTASLRAAEVTSDAGEVTSQREGTNVSTAATDRHIDEYETV